jgi:hypothetical protein
MFSASGAAGPSCLDFARPAFAFALALREIRQPRRSAVRAPHHTRAGGPALLFMGGDCASPSTASRAERERTRSTTSSHPTTHEEPQEAISRMATAHHGQPSSVAPADGAADLIDSSVQCIACLSQGTAPDGRWRDHSDTQTEIGLICRAFGVASHRL